MADDSAAAVAGFCADCDPRVRLRRRAPGHSAGASCRAACRNGNRRRSIAGDAANRPGRSGGVRCGQHHVLRARRAVRRAEALRFRGVLPRAAAARAARGARAGARAHRAHRARRDWCVSVSLSDERVIGGHGHAMDARARAGGERHHQLIARTQLVAAVHPDAHLPHRGCADHFRRGRLARDISHLRRPWRRVGRDDLCRIADVPGGAPPARHGAFVPGERRGREAVDRIDVDRGVERRRRAVLRVSYELGPPSG